MLYSVYVMVSIPEAKLENVYESPIILGVFDSKENARMAWKARTPDFKDIKAKTVHQYVETFITERTARPQSIYLWANYSVYGVAPEEKPEFVFMPYHAGYYERYEEYLEKKAWVRDQNPISKKEFCEKAGFVFYASNEDIVEKVELNRLIRIPVELTAKNT